MVILIMALLVFGVAVYVIATRAVKRDDLPEPPRDWWPEFERQFRAYAARMDGPYKANTRRQAAHEAGTPSQTPPRTRGMNV